MVCVAQTGQGGNHVRARNAAFVETSRDRALVGRYRDLFEEDGSGDASRTNAGTGSAPCAAAPRLVGRTLGVRPAWLHQPVGSVAPADGTRPLVLSSLLGGR